MITVANLVLPLFGLILLGFIAARLVRQSEATLGWLSIFIIYLALPALFFKLLAKTPIEQLANWDFIATNLGATFLVFLAVFLIARLVGRATRKEATIQGLAGAYGNIGYMGPALAILTFGEAAAVPVAIIFCFENIMHFSLVPIMMTKSDGGRQSSARLVLGIVRSFAFHPFIIATALGIAAAATQVSIPEPVANLVDYLAQAAAPSALFALGVTLAVSPLKRFPAELSFIVPAKILIHPLVMYLLLGWAGDFDRVWVLTAVLLAALPTATNVFVLAQQYGVWVNRASASLLTSTLASVLTLSALLYAVTTGNMPHDLFSS